MELTIPQQIIKLIKEKKRVLLCTHRKPDGDAIGSTLAMYLVLKKLGHEVTAACADEAPDNFSFLPDIKHLKNTISGAKSFIISLDCGDTEVDHLKYNLENNKINIIMTPKKGQFSKSNIEYLEGESNFDLIITLDVAETKQLGTLFEDNSELFTETPLINIDHHISNPGFGQVNHINLASSSTCEILYDLFKLMEKEFEKPLFDADVATFLLSGITTDTGSFQHSNTTPKVLEAAADLIEMGARQQDIIKYLFRTKKLPTLKLWGKVLNKLETDEKFKMIWSNITQRDIIATGAALDQSTSILDEIMVNAPNKDVIVLFKEDPDLISVSFRSTSPDCDVKTLAERFGGGGHTQAAGAKIKGKELSEVTQEVLRAARELQAKRLNLPESEMTTQTVPQGVVPQSLDAPHFKDPNFQTVQEKSEAFVTDFMSEKVLFRT
jgi:bifunctional oligoribonuclease and PAP phosphatase NrnA